MSVERRSVNLVDADVKGRIFRGYAAVFDTPWNETLTEATGYVEKVARGVFRKALASSGNIPLLLEHDPHQLLATTQSGNLKLKEDGKGLLVGATFPDNALAQYAASLIEAGDMRGMSYGISLDAHKDTDWDRNTSPKTRIIRNAKAILDVSLTWQPAYTATTVELRSTGFVAPTLQELDSGREEQTVDAATTEPPDDDEAWWGEKPADAVKTDLAKPWWESYIDQLEERF